MDRTKTIVDLLLAHGADINAKDNRGRTVLHKVHSESAEFVAFLLERGADVNMRDANGETPLFVTISQGSWQMDRTRTVIDLLLANGGDINAANNKGQNVLDKARAARPELVAFLLDRGADPNSDYNCALERDYEAIVELLRAAASASSDTPASSSPR